MMPKKTKCFSHENVAVSILWPSAGKCLYIHKMDVPVRIRSRGVTKKLRNTERDEMSKMEPCLCEAILKPDAQKRLYLQWSDQKSGNIASHRHDRIFDISHLFRHFFFTPRPLNQHGYGHFNNSSKSQKVAFFPHFAIFFLTSRSRISMGTPILTHQRAKKVPPK